MNDHFDFNSNMTLFCEIFIPLDFLNYQNNVKEIRSKFPVSHKILNKKIS